MFQARASQWDHRLYNVNRDCAHNFGDVMREVVARLEGQRWPVVVRWLESEQVSAADLAQACQAFCTFVASSTEYPREQMPEALTRCGWFATPPAAQAAVMAVLGTVLAGYFWAGVREANVLGDEPTQTYQDLRQMGATASRWLTRPVWQRWLLLGWRACLRRLGWRR
jgi:hypothetical protein